MTIYTPKVGDKKVEKSDYDPEAEILTGPLPAKKDEECVPPPPPPPKLFIRRRRGSMCANLCVVFIAILVLTTGIIGGIFLYRHLAHRTFRGWCSVKYYEYQHGEHHHKHAHHQKHQGHFEEKVEIDKALGKYEKIEVPHFDECKKASIVHDFEKNLTAIIDIDDTRCFVMKLNRSHVRPPKDFWDLITKLRSGYYMPDAKVVRQKYRALLPPVRDVTTLGPYIATECFAFETYRLERVVKGHRRRTRNASKNQAYGYFDGTTVEKIIVDVSTIKQ